MPLSGIQRRSIGNFDELQSSLEANLGNVLTIKLEKSSLAEQIGIFSIADVIVAQHGAALANLVWARPGTKVIEITARPRNPWDKCFPNLSACLGLDHNRVGQEGWHGACDVESVIALISGQTAIAKPTRLFARFFRTSK